MGGRCAHYRPLRRASPCRALGIAAIAVGFLAATSCRSARLQDGLPQLRLEPADRLLVLAPHPDDEVLCCGGLLQEAVRRELPVRVVFLTYGDANEWSFLAYRKRPTVRARTALAMGALRRREALQAAERLGVAAEDLVFLGYPDHGSQQIFLRRWGEVRPYRARLTRARGVPYDTAVRPGAPHRGEEILADLVEQIRAFQPTRIFVSHPADHHPDHAALYLFTRAALWQLEEEIAPTVHPYLVHFPRWPRVRGFRPEVQLAPPERLHAAGRWEVVPLPEVAVSRKRSALEAHATQYGYSGRRLLRLVRRNELFGDLRPLRLARPRAALELVDVEVHADEAMEPPPDLAPRLAPHFVDLERLRIERAKDSLLISARFAQTPAGDQRLILYAAGSRRDRPFAASPKLEVSVGAHELTARDRGRRLRGAAMRVERSAHVYRVEIPMKTLGRPERLLLGARIQTRGAPVDRVPWRVVELQ